MKYPYFILFIAFLCMTEAALAQTNKIVFTYDEAGNRKSRDIIVLTPPSSKGDNNTLSQEEESAPEIVEETLSSTKVTIYPNPTKGQLTLSFEQSTPSIMRYQLVDINGRLIESKAIEDTQHLIDISNQPNGVYVLQLQVDNQTHDWTIIKE